MDTPSLHHYPIKSIVTPVLYEKDHFVHSCKQLAGENKLRLSEGDKQIFLFNDSESNHWNMKIGSEFVRISYCPFCVEKL